MSNDRFRILCNCIMHSAKAVSAKQLSILKQQSLLAVR